MRSVISASCSDTASRHGSRGAIADAGDRELDELVELRAIERSVLASALHFYEFSFAAHYHVHVDLGSHIFLVIEIEPWFSVDDAHAHRRHAPIFPQ